jgi:hypothetical protein
MRIETWAVVGHVLDPYGAPETQGKSTILIGVVFGHPRFDNGHTVTTSSIIGKNNKNEIVTASGSAYKLGEVHQVYEAKFPDAKNRLLDSLPII